MGAWFLTPTPEGCDTVYVAEVDPRGNIPKSILKMSAKIQGEIVTNMWEWMIKKMKKRGKLFENGLPLEVGKKTDKMLEELKQVSTGINKTVIESEVSKDSKEEL